MTAVILRGDARHLPLPDASVDLIVTSPPYFALRSYTDGGEHYAGQIGSEGTPAEYIAALLDCTREWVRVLKPSGSLFVNLGDKYSTGTSDPGAWSESSTLGGGRRRPSQSARKIADTVRAKSLMGLPWRYALGCIDQLGLILRAEIVWSKPNGLPESVTDRVRRSHEQWFHMTRLPRYFAAVDEIREPHAAASLVRYASDSDPIGGRSRRRRIGAEGSPYDAPNPLGKLPGSVWDIPSEPLTVPDHLGVDHFAAFPTEFPKRIIAGWSPSGVCTVCGEGRRPVVHVGETSWARRKAAGDPSRYGAEAVPRRNGNSFADARDRAAGGLGTVADRAIVGEACACPEPTAPTTPATVLDPFGGTGTVALVASALGRTGISIDMSADYSRLAQWRTTDPAQRAKALGVPKPPTEVIGQGDLFTAMEGFSA